MALLALAGLIAFFLGISGPQSPRAWQAYLVNFVFWTGLSFGAVLFVAILNMTDAQWGRPLKRLAEALGAFCPHLSCSSGFCTLGGKRSSPGSGSPSRKNKSGSTPDFMFARNGVGLFLLTALSAGPDLLFRERGSRAGQSPQGTGKEESPTEEFQAGAYWRAQRVLSPIIGIAYAFVLSLLAFDLIMSLDPHWYSTLFGAYYFMSSFYLALAALYLPFPDLPEGPGPAGNHPSPSPP